MDKARRLLVTGGAGFIGSALIRHLLRNHDVQVLNVDKLTYAGRVSSLRDVADDSRYTFVHADICDAVTMQRTVEEFRPDAVMHLAAESHVDRSIDGPAAFIQTNITGTYTLLEVARRYWEALPKGMRAAFRFQYISTDEVYGSLGETGLFTETTRYDPRSPYSASKAAADHLVRAWYHTYGMPVLITNCSNNYGPYHFPEKLIPLVILNALNLKPLPIYGTGDNVRDWLYVDDHACALATVLEGGVSGETYNVGGSAERTNLQVVQAICTTLDALRPRDDGRPYDELITFVTDRPGHDKRYAIDASKITRNLGWVPRVSFETGICQTVQWYLDNEWWWGPIRVETYTGERLGKG